jgi:hypothetical protein
MPINNGNGGVHVYLNANREPSPVEITHTIKIDKPKPPVVVQPVVVPGRPSTPIWQIVLLIYAVLMLFAAASQHQVSSPSYECGVEIPDC